MKQAPTQAMLLLISVLNISGMMHAEPTEKINLSKNETIQVSCKPNTDMAGSVDSSKNKSSMVIVTVSGQEVMMNSETGKGIQERLQKTQKDLATPLQADEKKIRDKEQKLIQTKEKLDADVVEFEKNSKTMSGETRSKEIESLQERAQKLEDDKRELDRLVQKLQTEARKVEAKMGEVYQKEMGKFEAMVKETINDLAQKNGWDIVMMEDSMVYVNKQKLSKTKDVIAELDRRTKAANLAKKQALEAKNAAENKK